MKTMTCRQLGGACDQKFQAGTFEEIVAMSKKHGQEMVKKKDQPHIEAMKDMQKLMQTPGAISEWMSIKRAKFESLPVH